MTSHLSIPSPFGTLRISATERAVQRIAFQLDEQCPEADWRSANELLQEAALQLADYFCGRRQQFELPLAPYGSEFQQRVWAELQRIPFGITCSYGDIAERLGAPGSARAVGAANRSNPIAIVIPCHRVIGSNGTLTGYAGGLDRKRGLLLLESSGSGLGLAVDTRPALFLAEQPPTRS